MTNEEAKRYLQTLANRIPLKFFTEEEQQIYDEFSQVVIESPEKERTMIDLEKPMHFTGEQSEWIKAYCIIRNKEAYNEALNDFATEIKNVMEKRYMHDIYIDDVNAIINRLKKGTSND